jgi:hypothetical protein
VLQARSDREIRASAGGRWALGAILAASGFLWLGVSTAASRATTISVKSTADASDPTPTDGVCDSTLASHKCTLRGAVETANQHPGSEIKVPAGHYGLTINDLEFDASVRISGASAKRTVVDGGGSQNIFFVSSPGLQVHISRMTLTGGHDFPRGGAIYNYGDLTVDRSVISGNKAQDQGGGIFNNGGQLTVKRTTVSGNEAGSGAGIDSGNVGAGSLGDLRVIASTISHNHARQGDGGGLIALNGPVKVVNSTISQNTATGGGGGIAVGGSGAVTFESDTVARNVADSENDGTGLGGGLRNDGGSMAFTVKNSIVALNRYGNGNRSDCSGPFTAEGADLFTSLAGCAGFTTPPDIVRAHPRLGPLAKNGGLTKTIALKRHSSATNHARSGSPKRDQRGIKRDSHPDIGAFERN